MKEEIKKFYSASSLPLLFTLGLWVIHILKTAFNLDLLFLAMQPATMEGLTGILTSPLLHGDWEHLFSNSIPLLVLGTAFFYFYKEVAFQAGMWLYLLPGISLWIMGRPSYHLGASGLVYSFAFFLLISGFIRHNKSLKAISMIVIILYGSLVWGVFPVDPTISWEGHLGGLLSGVMLALVYRKQGPEDEKPKEFDDSDLDDVFPYWEVPDEKLDEDAKPVFFRYRYKKKED